MGGLPVLELDDGTDIAESVAICRYFEELKPEPRLMGVDAKDKAVVEMWNRRMEFEVLTMTAGAFRNTSDFFKGRIPQVKEYGEVCKNAALKRLEWLDTVLADREFIAGPRFTIADITALIGIDFGRTTRNQDPGESEEPRAMAPGGVEPSKREGVGRTATRFQNRYRLRCREAVRDPSCRRIARASG